MNDSSKLGIYLVILFVVSITVAVTTSVVMYLQKNDLGFVVASLPKTPPPPQPAPPSVQYNQTSVKPPYAPSAEEIETRQQADEAASQLRIENERIRHEQLLQRMEENKQNALEQRDVERKQLRERTAAHVKGELENENAILTKIIEQNNAQGDEIDALDASIAKVNKRVKSSAESVAIAQTKVNNARAEVSGTSARVAQLQGRGGQYQSTLNHAIEDKNRAASHLAEAQGNYAEKSAITKATTDELRVLMNKRTQTASAMTYSKTRADKASERIAKLESQLAEIEPKQVDTVEQK